MILRRAASTLISLTALSATLTAGLTACGSSSSPQAATPQTAASQAAPASRTIVDTAGRSVTIPGKINRIATIGLVPPNNSIVFALGESGKIVNGPPGGYSETYANYSFLAPNLVHAPAIEGAIGDPVNNEELLKLHPDLAIASDAKMAELVSRVGVPVVVISPTNPDGIKKSVTLLGKVFGKEALAAQYVKYFDDSIARLQKIGATVPVKGQPSLLYMSAGSPMRRPSRTIDWAAEMLGAAPVTASVTADGWYQFGIEQVLKWDPQVIIALYPSDKKILTTDPRYSHLQAVTSGSIYVTPTGAQLWGQTTSENPLGILWLAKTLRPEQTRDLDLASEVTSFYHTYFGVNLTSSQVTKMLTPSA